jgi:hypothetical protein
VQKYQLQFDKEHSHLLVQLKTQMAKLETERAVISERQKAWDSTSSQFNTARADLDRLKQENTVLISDLSVLRKENEVLKGSNLQLQQALELVNQKVR